MCRIVLRASAADGVSFSCALWGRGGKVRNKSEKSERL